MPVLSNPKHERFAQELAKGKSANEAYVLAGYAENDGNSIRLKGNERILARVAELLGRVAVRAELTVAIVADNLLRIAEKAEALGEASGLNVAKAAWMDAAKVSGLIVEKKEVRTGHLDELPADSITELREQLIAERARRADRGSGPQATGKPH